MHYDFGRAIKLLREEKGLTQIELAELSSVTRSTIEAYELGTRKPSAMRLGLLARALDIPVGVLYYMAEQEYKKGGSAA